MFSHNPTIGEQRGVLQQGMVCLNILDFNKPWIGNLKRILVKRRCILATKIYAERDIFSWLTWHQVWKIYQLSRVNWAPVANPTPDIPTISTKSYPASPDIGLTIILQQIFDLTMGRGMFRFKTRRTMDILTSTPYFWKVWSRISFVQCSKILSLFQQFPRDLHVPCIPKYQSTLKLRTLWDAQMDLLGHIK